MMRFCHFRKRSTDKKKLSKNINLLKSSSH